MSSNESESTCTSSTIDSSSEENETDIRLKTPKKRKYNRSLHYGITKKMANYFKVTPDKSCADRTHLYRSNDQSPTFDHAHSEFKDQVHVSCWSGNSSHESSLTTTDSCSDSDLSSTESDIDTESSDELTCSSENESYLYMHESTYAACADETNIFKDVNSNNDLDIPLYEGCRQTQRSAYIMIMLFVMHNSLSNEAFSGLLQLISSFLPKNAKFTQSVYKIKETLKSTVEFQNPVKHFYCEECQQYCENGEMCENASCNLNNGRPTRSRLLEFIDLNVEQQLKDIFKDTVFLRNLRQTEGASRSSQLRDILDGSFYKDTIKRFQTGADVYITFTLNTDGVSLFSSSKKGSLWPVYLAINELPVKLRFSRKYLMPCFLHCQVEKPNMFNYLKPLMKTLNKLHREGIEVDTPNGKLSVKAHLLASSLDLPARALVTYMKQFNGKQACCVCLDEGETSQGNQLHRFYPFQENMTIRTNESFRQDATEAARTGAVVNGIRGPSSFLMLPYTDMAKMFPIDWMHCVHLGITKALMGFWFDAKHRREDYFIGDKMALLNKRFLSLKIPDFVARRQRGLNDHGHWKASECREWLIHFSTPVLYGILPAVPYVHHLLLVSSMGLLSKDGIRVEDIDRAESMLMLYCKMYPEIYGEQSQTMNVHLLRHLASTVKQFGPLYGFSCYGFESMNSYLKSMVHGTGHVNSQVCFAVGMSKQITNLVQQYIHGNVDDTLKSLAESLGSKLIKEDRTVKRTLTALGQRKPLNPASIYYNAVNADIHANNPSVFLRLQNGEEVLYSKEYQKRKTRNSYTICFIHNQEEMYGSIVTFICTSKSYAVVEKFHTEEFKLTQDDKGAITNTQLSEFNKLCEHIVMVVSEATECLIIPVENIVTKCVFMKIGPDLIFLSKPPNLLEHN